MAGQQNRTAPHPAIQNLRQPMPLGRKFSLYARNIWRRVRYRSTCCGHPGEPGC